MRGTLVGVLFVGVIVNGMRLLDVQEDAQLIARGALVLWRCCGPGWERNRR